MLIHLKVMLLTLSKINSVPAAPQRRRHSMDGVKRIGNFIFLRMPISFSKNPNPAYFPFDLVHNR